MGVRGRAGATGTENAQAYRVVGVERVLRRRCRRAELGSQLSLFFGRFHETTIGVAAMIGSRVQDRGRDREKAP